MVVGLLFYVVLLSLFTITMGRSPHYYDMINDINNGTNYYLELQISEDATVSEIKKAYRSLSRVFHPDKNKDPGAKFRYMKIQTAHDILVDEETRAEYDELLKFGVPWEEQYYGRYVHRYGVPQHDIRYVLISTILLITIAKHCYQWYRHVVTKEQAKNSAHYKLRNIQLKKEMEFSTSKKPQNSENTEDSEIPEELEVVIHGCEMPTWKDLFLVQMVKFPFKVVILLFGWIRKPFFPLPTLSEEERIEVYCKEAGITREEFENRKKKYLEKMEKFRNSSKYKRTTRFLKKNR